MNTLELSQETVHNFLEVAKAAIHETAPDIAKSIFKSEDEIVIKQVEIAMAFGCLILSNAIKQEMK